MDRLWTPFVIGIAGGTGSGKTTIAQKIAESVPRDRVAVIEHDAYYRDLAHLGVRERDAVNFDHPDALETELLVQHLAELRQGRGVDIPIYDFATHTRRSDASRIRPCPLLLVEGILALADSRLRELLDLKVYVDTDADLRILRRLERDIGQRGRSFESVCHQYYSSVRPMHLQFVEPSKRWADIIVPEGAENRAAIDLLIFRVQNLLGSP
jgi:uridine kinase